MPQKGHHDIYIIKVGNEYRVRPSVWSTNGEGEAAKVRIRNLTDEEVLVVFPTKLLAGSGASVQTLTKKMDDRPPAAETGSQTGDPNVDFPDTKTVVLDVSKPGVYPYTVIVKTDLGTTVAVGESEPVVIIDPPPV